MSDIWFPLLQHEHFHLSCMSRCSSIGNVITVHVYLHIYDDEKGARAAIWHMVPISRTWAVSYFVHAHMLWAVVQLGCDSVLYHYNVLNWILAVSSFVHEQMFFNRNCKHRSRIHTKYDNEKGARTAIWHMVTITRTWAVSSFEHAHMFGNISTVHVYIWRWKLASTEYVESTEYS